MKSVGLAKGAVPAAYQSLVQKWGNLCGAINPALLAAQLYQESGLIPRRRARPLPLLGPASDGASGQALSVPDADVRAAGGAGRPSGLSYGWDAAGQAWTGLGKLLTGIVITGTPLGAAYWLTPAEKLPSWLRDSRTAPTACRPG
jgi:hypothetical protein